MFIVFLLIASLTQAMNQSDENWFDDLSGVFDTTLAPLYLSHSFNSSSLELSDVSPLSSLFSENSPENLTPQETLSHVPEPQELTVHRFPFGKAVRCNHPHCSNVVLAEHLNNHKVASHATKAAESAYLCLYPKCSYQTKSSPNALSCIKRHFATKHSNFLFACNNCLYAEKNIYKYNHHIKKDCLKKGDPVPSFSTPYFFVQDHD